MLMIQHEKQITKEYQRNYRSGNQYTSNVGIEFVKNKDGSTLRTSRGRSPDG